MNLGRTLVADPEKMQTARAKAALTVFGLARKAIVSERSVRNAMNGKPVYLNTLRAITDALKVKLEDVLPGTEIELPATIQIYVEGKYVDVPMVKMALDDFLKILERAMGAKGEIKVVKDPESGSVIITLEMSAEDAASLARIFPDIYEHMLGVLRRTKLGRDYLTGNAPPLRRYSGRLEGGGTSGSLRGTRIDRLIRIIESLKELRVLARPAPPEDPIS